MLPRKIIASAWAWWWASERQEERACRVRPDCCFFSCFFIFFRRRGRVGRERVEQTKKIMVGRGRSVRVEETQSKNMQRTSVSSLQSVCFGGGCISRCAGCGGRRTFFSFFVFRFSHTRVFRFGPIALARVSSPRALAHTRPPTHRTAHHALRVPGGRTLASKTQKASRPSFFLSAPPMTDQASLLLKKQLKGGA